MTNRRRYIPLAKDAANFSAVGAICYLLDVLIFNGFLLVVPNAPLLAKTAGVLAATIAAWLGTRYWTFRRTRRRDTGAELAEFMVVSVAGYLVNLGVLALSHYSFGFHSPLADNIAGNVVGAALGAALRFFLYRHWVYSNERNASIKNIKE